MGKTNTESEYNLLLHISKTFATFTKCRIDMLVFFQGQAYIFFGKKNSSQWNSNAKPSLLNTFLQALAVKVFHFCFFIIIILPCAKMFFNGF